MHPTGDRRPLLALAPEIPCIDLATLPTPLRTLTIPALAPIHIKDDGASGSLYGGNKLRKLEFLFADALAQGYGRVWTIGAIGSNHVTATSAWGRRLGIAVDALHFPQPITRYVVRNIAAVVSQCTRLSLVGSIHALPARVALEKARAAARRGAGATYEIPGGGSSPVGCLGYVNAALELCAQLRADNRPLPDRVYVAAGTAGTLAGLVAGFTLAGAHGVEVHGVRVTDRVVCNDTIVEHLLAGVRRILASHGVETPQRTARWVLRHDQFGPAYGVGTDAGRAAIDAAAEHGGLYLEATYTAKAFAALLADLSGTDAPQRPLYWHTLNDRNVMDLVAPDFGRDRLPRGYARFFDDPAADGWDSPR